MSDNSFGLLIRPDDLKWVETPGGNAVKVLRVSEETGAWSALFRAAKGTTNAPHIHLGPADFYVLSGVLEFRGGVAKAGDWIYEPNGAVHEATHHPEETVYLSNVFGAIGMYAEDMKTIQSISDWRGMKAIQDLQGR